MNAVDWLVREWAATWLRSAGLPDPLSKLRPLGNEPALEAALRLLIGTEKAATAARIAVGARPGTLSCAGAFRAAYSTGGWARDAAWSYHGGWAVARELAWETGWQAAWMTATVEAAADECCTGWDRDLHAVEHALASTVAALA